MSTLNHVSKNIVDRFHNIMERAEDNISAAPEKITFEMVKTMAMANCNQERMTQLKTNKAIREDFYEKRDALAKAEAPAAISQAVNGDTANDLLGF